MPEEATTPDCWLAPPPDVSARWLVCRRVQPTDAAALYEAVAASLEHLRPWMSCVGRRARRDRFPRRRAARFRHLERDLSTSTRFPGLDEGGEPVVEGRDNLFLAHGAGGPGRATIRLWISTRREQTYRQENRRGPY